MGAKKGDCKVSKSRGIKRANVGWVSFFVGVLVLSGWMANSLAREGQRTQVDMNALIHETQKMVQKTDELAVVWWIPEEYWRVSFEQDATMSKAQVEQFLKALRPYTLIAVIEGKIGAFGGVTYKAKADVRKRLEFKDSQGIRYRPLSEDQVSADVKNFLSIMKPVLANMLGPLGQNVHFFVFPAKNKSGQRIADAKKKGMFWVKLGAREFRWRLPLGSLLPPKICPKCAEKCNGAWNYCPWCGMKLLELKK